MIGTASTSVSVEDPYFASRIRAIERTGGSVDPRPILEALGRRALGGASSQRRYRWDFPYLDLATGAKVPRFRPREAQSAARDPTAHARRLWLPTVLAPTLDWLCAVAEREDEAALLAGHLLDESAPTVADDLATYVTARDAWADTFALATFCRYPRVLARTADLVTAICARYVGVAARHDGLVVGRHFPFHDVALPSASAYVATAIAALGIGTQHLSALVRFLMTSRRPDGGWGDPEQDSDVLTTLASARLLATLDPTFDPASAEAFVAEATAATRFQIIGPEAPWLEDEVASFRDLGRRPFSERFAWPHVPVWALDRNIGAPRFDAFVDLSRLLAGVPGLADSHVELAFVDLANFGAWNTRYGQAAGDELLRFLVDQLRSIPASRVYRDGGDEFLLVGAPGRVGLADDLRESFAGWGPAWGALRPAVDLAHPRAVICAGRADGVRDMRERLGRAIGDLKHRRPDPDRAVVEEA